MKEYIVYHMRRHDPPVGSMHLRADPVGSVQAASAAHALRLANDQWAALWPNLAIGDKEDVIHESVQKTIARANRSIYTGGGAALPTGNEQPPRVLRSHGAHANGQNRAAKVRAEKGV